MARLKKKIKYKKTNQSYLDWNVRIEEMEDLDLEVFK